MANKKRPEISGRLERILLSNGGEGFDSPAFTGWQKKLHSRSGFFYILQAGAESVILFSAYARFARLPGLFSLFLHITKEGKCGRKDNGEIPGKCFGEIT